MSTRIYFDIILEAGGGTSTFMSSCFCQTKPQLSILLIKLLEFYFAIIGLNPTPRNGFKWIDSARLHRRYRFRGPLNVYNLKLETTYTKCPFQTWTHEAENYFKLWTTCIYIIQFLSCSWLCTLNPQRMKKKYYYRKFHPPPPNWHTVVLLDSPFNCTFWRKWVACCVHTV